MQISNIRLGHATNSSSTHSIVFPAPAGLHDDVHCRFEYGWDNFILRSKKAKQDYLAATLFTNLQDSLGDDIALAVVNDWIGPYNEEDKESLKRGYVDHQSCMTIPNDFKGQPSRKFFEDLKEYYLQDGLAILGGNDNSEYEWPFPTDEHKLIEYRAGESICRKDGDWWTIFNKGTGCKIRMSFRDDAKPYEKSTTPEIVDLKITGYCPFKCPYCYQASSDKGVHAKRDNLMAICYDLADAEVFEVAIGGGEPTLHPQFENIVREFHRVGVTPSFSTRNYDLVNDDNFLKLVKECCGRMAFSVDEPRILTQILGVMDSKHMLNKLSFHYVMGARSLESLVRTLEILRSYPVTIVLLGFKRMGHGARCQPRDYSDWLSVVEKAQEPYSHVSISIDTALARESKEQLERVVNQRLVNYDEGKFSMYIDAVDMVAGPSSFCLPGQLVPYENGEVARIFARW